jgi:steroid delta-isomerase-like uncharacterized protein
MTASKRAEIVRIARRWIEEGWRHGNSGVVDELHAPDFVDRDSAGRPADNKGFKLGIERLYAAFPDLVAEVRDLVVDEEAGSIAVRWSAQGTHRKAYLGAEPSGEKVRFKGIEILRISNGLIAERWGEWDGIDLLEQLGRVRS